jgi:hypothetical protein
MVRVRGVGSVVAWLVLAAAPAASAQRGQDGALVGNVVDISGAVLVGASVVVSSPQQIGGPRSTTTDQAGRYRFALLAPGDYAIEASLPGFKTTRVDAVRIPPGLAITVDVPLALDSLAETVDVQVPPAAMDVRSAASPAALERVLLDTLPLSRDVHTYINLVPGVVESVAFGGTVRANPLTIDGASGNEPRTGTPTSPFARTWIEEVQFLGPGSQAQHGEFTGMTMNALTRSGADRYSGLAEYRVTGQSWTGNNRGDLPPDLASGFRPLQVVERWEGIGQVGGPVLHSRLWFFGGGQQYRDRTRAAAFGAGPPTADELVPTLTTRRGIGKLTATLGRAGRAEAFAARNVNIGRQFDAGPQVRPEATTHDDRTDDLWNVRYQATAGARWAIEARHGGNRRDQVSGAPGERRHGPPGHIDIFTGVYSVNALYYDEWDSYVHTTAAAVTGHLDQGARGTHDVRVGAEYERASVLEALSYPGGLIYFDDDGRSVQAEIWEGGSYRGRHRRVTAYVQDSWNVGPVTANLGIRFDDKRADPPYSATYRTQALAPRIGLAWDIGRNHDTVLRAHYGRYHDPIVAGYYDFRDPLSWAPFITADVVGPNQFVELSRFTPASAYAIDPEIKSSYVAEGIAGVERALPAHISLKAQFIHRQFEDTAGFIDPGTIWEPRQVRDPGPDGREGTADDGGLITVFNNANPGGAQRLLTNPPQAYRRYRAVQVIAARRPSGGPTFQVSYTWSRTRGSFDNGAESNAASNDNSSGGVFANPNRAINRDGPTSFDYSHSFKALGTWQLPGRWTVSGFYRVESGKPWGRMITVRGLSQGGQNVLVERFVRRTPTTNVADLRVEKTFRVRAVTAGAYMDVFNVTNAGVARAYFPTSGPLFGRPSRWLEPRTAMAGARLSF